MKKFLAMIISLVFVCGLAFTAACKSGDENVDKGNQNQEQGTDQGTDKNFSKEDTFAGALSEESYSSDEKAVEAFLEKEISGAAVTAELVDFKSSGKLAQNEIDALEKDGVISKEEIESIEIVEVRYKNTKTALTSASVEQEEDDYFTFTLYVVEFTPHGSTVKEYRYLVPRAKNGDAVTKSYYEDLLDPEKYINCTQEYKNDAVLYGEGLSIEINQTYTVKVDQKQASIAMKLMDPKCVPPQITYMNLLGFFEESDSFRFYLSMDNGATYQAPAVNPFISYGITDMKSFTTICLPKIDYSYYEKTDYGFKINDEFINEYAKKTMSGYDTSYDISVELCIYVSDGKVSKMTARSDMSLNGSKISSSNEELLFSAFGTTSVERPSTIPEN